MVILRGGDSSKWLFFEASPSKREHVLDKSVFSRQSMNVGTDIAGDREVVMGIRVRMFVLTRIRVFLLVYTEHVVAFQKPAGLQTPLLRLVGAGSPRFEDVGVKFGFGIFRVAALTLHD